MSAHESFEGDLLELAELAEAGVAAASLAHEVRQPLFALRALAQLGRDGSVALPMADVLEVIDHLEVLLTAWSDVGRREEPRLYDISEVVGGVLRMLEGRRRQLGVELTYAAVSPVWATGSPSTARQIALNLVSNALDAVVDAPERHVRVDVSRVGQDIRLVVHDTGMGVDPAIRGRMFEAFVTSKPAGKGTGLGLYVAHRLCIENGGSLIYAAHDPGTQMTAQFSAGPMKKA